MPRILQKATKSTKTVTRDDVKETDEATKKPRKPYRHKPGTLALREIRRLQKGTDLLLRKAPFKRIIRDILSEINPEYKMKAEAYIAYQNIVEDILYRVNQRASYFVRLSKLQRVRPMDVEMAAMTLFPQFYEQPLEAAFVLPKLRVRPPKNKKKSEASLSGPEKEKAEKEKEQKSKEFEKGNEGVTAKAETKEKGEKKKRTRDTGPETEAKEEKKKSKKTKKGSKETADKEDQEKPKESKKKTKKKKDNKDEPKDAEPQEAEPTKKDKKKGKRGKGKN